jgi:SET domain-containing protein
MSKKDRLLSNLENDTYVRLRPSPLQGVGVFAIKDIPKGVNPFKMPNKPKYNSIKCTATDLKNVDPVVKKMINDFIEPDDTSYYIPENGLNSLDLTFYLNHSNDNNLGIIDDNDNDEYSSFVTLRIIEKGEELLINYKDYKN